MSFLDKFKKLRPVSFNLKRDEFPEYKFGDKREVGLIAQEVEEIFPDLVGEWKDGYKGVNYGQIPMYLIIAIQELQKEIEELRKKHAK